MMDEYKEHMPILLRIAFVLGNLTTHFEEVRITIG
jgi:hypothetical protein